MKVIEIKQYDINEVDEITLLSTEEAKLLPKHILTLGDWWWLRSPGCHQERAIYVSGGGDVSWLGCYVDDYNAVRPAFRIKNLNSKKRDKIMIGNTWCTVIGVDLALADCSICAHRFDEKSNAWETSELRKLINSDEFKAMI